MGIIYNLTSILYKDNNKIRKKQLKKDKLRKNFKIYDPFYACVSYVLMNLLRKMNLTY